MRLKPRWVSFSSLDGFLKCERQWYYRRVLRELEPPSMYLAIGNFYHSVLEVMVQCTLGPNELKEVIDELYVEHASAPSWRCPTSEDVLKEEVHKNVLRVWTEVIKPMTDAGAELKCEKEHKYLAKVDLLTTKHPIVEMGAIKDIADKPGVLDYKIKFSTWNRRTNEDAAASAQLAMYCILENVSWAGFVEIPRSTSASINILCKEFSDEELCWWSRYLDTQTAAVRHRKASDESAFRLAAPDNGLCSERFCSFWNRCPGGKKP